MFDIEIIRVFFIPKLYSIGRSFSPKVFYLMFSLLFQNYFSYQTLPLKQTPMPARLNSSGNSSHSRGLTRLPGTGRASSRSSPPRSRLCLWEAGGLVDVEEEALGGKGPDHFLGREVEADLRTRWLAAGGRCWWTTTLSCDEK